VFRAYTRSLRAWLDRRPEEMGSTETDVGGLEIAEDPEAIFQEGWLLCDVGEQARGLELLERAVARGYCVTTTLARSRAFDGVRDDPAFQALLAEAEAGRERAAAAFREAGGERLLGR
jgi:hypothetical protein